jgi:DNA-binding CsgD family transcriptional regulator
LYERGAAVRLIEAALERRMTGGGVVLVEGTPGIGKSALLAAAIDVQAPRTFVARGYELEATFPFAVVRQLLDSPWRAGESPEPVSELATAVLGPESHAIADVAAVFHGLYWFVSDLAASGPITLVVDDAQWADDPSLAFLGYLTRRIDDLPVALVVATRPVGRSTPSALRDLAHEPAVQRLALEPLSPDAVALVVDEQLGRQTGAEPERTFVDACHKATGGNPFLLHALLAEVRLQNLVPSATAAADVGSLTPSGASRAIAVRVLRLDESARRVLEAVAVLGDGARLDDVAALAGIGERGAASAAVTLRDAGLVRPDGDALTCAHAIVRTSVLAEIDPLVLTSWRREAADVLRAHGRSDAEVAVHLAELSTLKEEDLETLTRAATAALSLGSPEVAANLLARVASERAGTDTHGHALLLLGTAEFSAGIQSADDHFRTAVELLPDGPDRLRAALQLARARKFRGGAEEAVRALESALNDATAARDPLAIDIELELVGLAYSSVAARATVLHRLDESPERTVAQPPSSEREAFMSAALAFETSLRGEDHVRATDLARHATRREPLPADPLSSTGFGVLMAANALMWCDQFDHAEQLHGHVIEAARRAGAPVALSTALALRALVRWRSGRLADSEADAVEALRLTEHLHVSPPLLPAAIAAGALVAVDRAQDDDALARVEGLLAIEVDADATPYGLVRHARGRMLVAMRRLAEGAEELLAAGAFEEAWGAHNPAVMAWRSDAARALQSLGRHEHAVELAEEELRRARAFGAPRAIGVALGGIAAVTSGDERVALLEESVRVLEASGARLEHARALIELGDAQRALRRTDEARAVLRLGLDQAAAVGAFRLIGVATEALRACGARPRRHAITGIAALTPSERRVVQLAAAGASNRGIAQQLFVSEKTIETHLSHAYDKLGVRERRRLAELLRT